MENFKSTVNKSTKYDVIPRPLVHITTHNFYIVPSQIRMSPAVTMAEIFVALASRWAADLGWTFSVLPTCSISEDDTSEQAVPSQSHNPSFLHCFFFFLKEQAFGSLLTPYPWPFCAPLAVPSSYLPLSAPPWMKERTHRMSRRMWMTYRYSGNESQSTRWAYIGFATTRGGGSRCTCRRGGSRCTSDNSCSQCRWGGSKCTSSSETSSSSSE